METSPSFLTSHSSGTSGSHRIPVFLYRSYLILSTRFYTFYTAKPPSTSLRRPAVSFSSDDISAAISPCVLSSTGL